MKKITIILLLIIGSSCSSDDDGISTQGFEPITEQYPFHDLNPANNNDYWELIFAIYGDSENLEEEIIASNGVLCLDQGTSCEQEFRKFQSQIGFARSCFPGLCFLYLKYQSGGENHLVTTKDELLEFLGEIDNWSEALLWAQANDYNFQVDNLEEGAIKILDSGYDLIVTKLVKHCLPIQTNRYHIRMETNGDIKILKEEVLSVMENGCI